MHLATVIHMSLVCGSYVPTNIYGDIETIRDSHCALGIIVVQHCKMVCVETN
jgi:hypothetical protein